jgi:hypothetical protein
LEKIIYTTIANRKKTTHSVCRIKSMSHKPDYVVAAWIYIDKNPDKLKHWYIHLRSHPIESKNDLNKAACLWLKNVYVQGKAHARERSYH